MGALRVLVNQDSQNMITPICTLAMLKAVLRNINQHGLQKHKGDWFHDMEKVSKGTLSYDWFN